MTILPEILCNLRKQKNVRQKDIAQALNISSASYNMYEKGKREPNIEMLRKMADYFGVSMDYLITGESTFDDSTNKKESNSPGEYYYLNDETRQIAQEAFENPDMRTLFHVARDIDPEELRAHIDFMKRLKAREKGDPDEPC